FTQEGRMLELAKFYGPATARSLEPDAAPGPLIPVIDVRRSGPVEHARISRRAMIALREECFSLVPRPLRWLASPLDRLSSAWLARTPSPYTDEIAAISD